MSEIFEFTGNTKKQLLDLGVYELSSIVSVTIPESMMTECTPITQSINMVFTADIDGVIEFALSGLHTVYDGDVFDIYPQVLNVIQGSYDHLIELAKIAHSDALEK